MRQGNYLSQRCVGVENQFKLLQGSVCFHEGKKKRCQKCPEVCCCRWQHGKSNAHHSAGALSACCRHDLKIVRPKPACSSPSRGQSAHAGSLERSKCFPFAVTRVYVFWSRGVGSGKEWGVGPVGKELKLVRTHPTRQQSRSQASRAPEILIRDAPEKGRTVN